MQGTNESEAAWPTKLAMAQRDLEEALAPKAASAEGRLADHKELRGSVERLTKGYDNTFLELDSTRRTLQAKPADRTKRAKSACAAQKASKALLQKIQENTDTLILDHKRLQAASDELANTVALQNEQLAATGASERKNKNARDSLRKRLELAEEERHRLPAEVARNDSGRRREVRARDCERTGGGHREWRRRGVIGDSRRLPRE
jgi:23S rRNA pseudoU1915 N3-methylase RlmH